MATKKAAKKTAKFQNESAKRQYEYDMQTFYAQKADLEREAELTDKFNAEKFNYEQSIRNLQKLSILDQYKKSNEDYQTQLLYNQMAADAAVTSQNNVYKGRVGDIKQQAQDLQIQQQRESIATDYQLGQIGFTLDQALFKAKQDKKSTMLDYKNQMLSIESQKSDIALERQLQEIQKMQLGIEQEGLDLAERNAVADRNFEMITANIDFIQQEGAARATGQSGQSAAASIQSAQAAFALDTAQISDALYRAQEEIGLQEKELGTRRKRLKAEGKALKRESKLLGKQSKLAKESKNLSLSNIRQSAKFAKRSAKLDVNQIAKTLKLDAKVFTMNKQRLGESLIAAAEERKFAMSEIARGKFMADKQAQAARMLPPRFAPDPPRPYKTELPTLIAPPKPVKVSSGQFASPQPKKQSGFSKILSIGGAILGIAGAAVTGGASLGLGMGFGSAAAASTAGGVLGGVSKGLGLIGQYTY